MWIRQYVVLTNGSASCKDEQSGELPRAHSLGETLVPTPPAACVGNGFRPSPFSNPSMYFEARMRSPIWLMHRFAPPEEVSSQPYPRPQERPVSSTYCYVGRTPDRWSRGHCGGGRRQSANARVSNCPISPIAQSGNKLNLGRCDACKARKARRAFSHSHNTLVHFLRPDRPPLGQVRQELPVF